MQINQKFIRQYHNIVLYATLSLVLVGCSILKQPMPVSVTSRYSAIGAGYVAQFQNTSDKHLIIRIILTNRTLGQREEDSIELEPFGTKELGWLEGWKFVSGDTITLVHEDYVQNVDCQVN